MVESNQINIVVARTTHKKLKARGQMHETFDHILVRLMDERNATN